MSRDFNDSNSDFLSRAGAVLTASPISLFCWFNSDDATAGEWYVSFGISGSDNNNIRLGADSTAGKARLENNAALGSHDGINTATSHTTGTWENALGTIDSGSPKPMAIYLNGGGKGSRTSTLTPSGINYTRISGNTDAAGQHFDGRLAHVAIWNVALTDEEAAALGANRISPLCVRRSALVAYYPFIGRDSPEIDVIGGNTLTVTGTTVSATDPPILWIPGRKKIIIPAAGAAPAFSSGPTINSTTTSAYTIGYTPTAACTFYAVAIVSGGTAPSAAQVVAGVDYAGGDVIVAANEAVVGADTTVLGGSLTRPVHDVYCVLNNGGGSSAVAAITLALLSAAAGRQYVTGAEPVGGWDAESIFYGATPAAVTGDIGDVSSTMTALSGGGEVCEIDTDGIISYTPIPPTDLTRRTVTRRFWDISLDDWSDVSPVIFYINNQLPDGPEIPDIFIYETGLNGTDINLNGIFTDAEAQAMTYATTPASTSFPAWASIVGTNIVIGTPATLDDITVSVRATDDTGIDFSDGVLRLVSLAADVSVPELRGLDSGVAFTQISEAFLSVGDLTIRSSARQGGIVIDQSPAAGTLVDAGSEVDLVFASGDVIRYDLRARGRKFAQY